MQVGSRGPPLLRSQTSLLVFLTPSLASTSSLAAVRPCYTYLAIANLALPKRRINASYASRHAYSAAAAAATQQPSPDDASAEATPRPLLRPRPPRSPEEIKSRQSTLLDRFRNPSKRQVGLGTKEDMDRQINSLLATNEEATNDDVDPPPRESESTIDWTERTISEQRAAQRQKDFETAQMERTRQDGKQGRIFRGMRMPQTRIVPAQEQPTGFGIPEATRTTATIKSRPSLGRTVEVLPDRGMDLGKALKSLEINCAVNCVRKDANKQRFHERPGLKRKRLKSERWRRRFKIGFKEVVAKVKSMRRKGW